MKRSYFLSRLHSRPHRRVRHTRKVKKHPRYHSYTHRGHRGGRERGRRNKYTRRIRGGMEKTVNTMDGTAVSEDALVTNSKGVTSYVKNRVMPWNNAETNRLKGDNDV